MLHKHVIMLCATGRQCLDTLYGAPVEARHKSHLHHACNEEFLSPIPDQYSFEVCRVPRPLAVGTLTWRLFADLRPPRLEPLTGNANVVVKPASRDLQTTAKQVTECALLGYIMKDELQALISVRVAYHHHGTPVL